MTSATLLRLSTLLLAILVGAPAAWLFASEIMRPPALHFPSDKAAADAVAAQHARAARAATIGMVRGSLWAEAAVSLGAPALFAGGSAAPATVEEARMAAKRAIALAPHKSAAWLLLAGTEARDLLGPLKMSYYTAPNDAALIPLRLTIATRGNAVVDPELQLLAAGDLRTILLRRPDMKPVVLAAYAGAAPEGRRFIEATAAALDPSFVAQLRSGAIAQ